MAPDGVGTAVRTDPTAVVPVMATPVNDTNETTLDALLVWVPVYGVIPIATTLMYLLASPDTNV